MKKGVPIRTIAARYPWIRPRSRERADHSKAERQEGKDKGHDGGNGEAFAAHVLPAAGDGERQEQGVVPVAPVQAAGERIAPVVAAPEQEAGMHVPDEPGVPSAVGFLQKGKDEGGRPRRRVQRRKSRPEGSGNGIVSRFPEAAAPAAAAGRLNRTKQGIPRSRQTPRSMAGR